MQWMLPVGWLMVILWGTASRQRVAFLRLVLALGLLSAMGLQLLVLHLDNQLNLQTGLPLHLCGLFGLVCVPLLWYAPALLFEALMYLGAPAAALALLFPAPAGSSHPLLTHWAFFQLHAILALTPLFFLRTGKPLPIRAHRALVLGNGYLVFVCAFNRMFQSNYLFLQAAPSGTPLALLFSRGSQFYLCSLELLCMLILSLLIPLYAQSRKYVIM